MSTQIFHTLLLLGKLFNDEVCLYMTINAILGNLVNISTKLKMKIGHRNELKS